MSSERTNTKKKSFIEYSKTLTKNVERCMEMLNITYDGDDEFPTIVAIQAREHQKDLEEFVEKIKTKIENAKKERDFQNEEYYKTDSHYNKVIINAKVETLQIGINAYKTVLQLLGISV